eukprot:Sdes_comp25645_c0_seq1m22824
MLIKKITGIFPENSRVFPACRHFHDSISQRLKIWQEETERQLYARNQQISTQQNQTQKIQIKLENGSIIFGEKGKTRPSELFETLKYSKPPILTEINGSYHDFKNPLQADCTLKFIFDPK